MSFTCHSWCHLYVTRMYSYFIRMSLVCTRMSFLCHLYVIVCHLYVTHMYSHVTRMSFVCTRMSSVCYSHVLVCHPYATRMYSYVIRMSLVCGFTMNPHFPLQEQSCKLYSNKYMITLTQITNPEIFTFIAVLVFKLLSRKVLFMNRTDNRNC